MCDYDVLGMVQRCFKTVVACLCFLILGGPALIIAGTTFLRKENKDREELRKAVRDFDPKPIEAWSGTINNVGVTVRRENLNVVGVDGAQSVFVEADVPAPNATSQLFSVNVNISTIKPFVRTAAMKIDRKSSYDCTSSNCRQTTGGCKCDNGLEKFKQWCHSKGGKFVPGSTCVQGNRCGRCEQQRYLRRLYLVAREISKGNYEEDPDLKSAKYDFGDLANDYQSTLPSTITVRLYSNKDPLITHERSTRGLYIPGADFRKIAIMMIVIGVLLTSLEICVCVLLICYCLRRKGSSTQSSGPPQEVPANAWNGPSNAYGQSPPPPQQGYTYGQPPPPAQQDYTYGQPPPPVQQGYTYGQPPPPAQQDYTYGQPPPPVQQGYTYGQPPPPAQQGYTYGQPPPPAQQDYTYGQPPPPVQQGYTYGQPPPASQYQYGKL